MEALYDVVGVSRQAFFDNEIQCAKTKLIVCEIIKQIKLIREDHPQMGARKVYHYMQQKPEYQSYISHIGRDKLETVLLNNDLRIKKVRSYVKTTIRGAFVFSNLITEFVPTAINQVWVSDLTYFITVVNGQLKHFYITLIMDLFSREGIGFAASDNMVTENTALAALRRAFIYRNVKDKEIIANLIFHSDGGGQFSDKGFLKELAKHEIKSSMGKSAYENPNAERLNGIIKNEYLIPWGVNSITQLILMLPKAITLYNTQRPHFSLNYYSPFEYKSKYDSLFTQG
jgi:putative transposase